MGAATLVLAVTAFVSSQASGKRFTAFTTAVTAAGTVKVIGSSAIFTTVANTHQVSLRTAGGTSVNLFTKAAKVKTAYLR